MKGRRLSAIVTASLLGAVFVVCVLYPLGVMAARSLGEEGRYSLDRYRLLFDMSNRGNLEAVMNSVGVSLVSVAASGVLGVFLAFVFTQLRFSFRSPLARLAVLPVALPPLVGVIAFLFVFGDTGIVPEGCRSCSGRPDPSSLQAASPG